MKIKTIELKTNTTPYVLSKGIDHALKELTRALKDDLLANRANLTDYVITLERK